MKYELDFIAPSPRPLRLKTRKLKSQNLTQNTHQTKNNSYIATLHRAHTPPHNDVEMMGITRSMNHKT